MDLYLQKGGASCTHCITIMWVWFFTYTCSPDVCGQLTHVYVYNLSILILVVFFMGIASGDASVQGMYVLVAN